MTTLASLLALAGASAQADLPQIPYEFRAAWVATVDNIDWPSKRTLTTAQQQAELVAIFNKAQELNLNAIVFQIRPSADALYESKIEPWSEYLTGQQGRAPNPRWDPLQFAIDEARKRGMELHCWFNPYRALHPAQKGPLAPNHIGVTHPHLAKKYGRYLWMDPGEPVVQQRSLAVMMDVVRRYDIDGVHIDDYFYPYKSYADGADFPDGPSWQRYRAGGGRLSRDDWRRKNVDDFIERLYGEIKKEKRWVKFGISPFGIYRPGHPPEVKAGFDQYTELYADALKWWERGWCDYYAPQLYWQIGSPQPYPALLNWWADKNKTGRHLWPGNFTSQAIAPPTGRGWPGKEIVDQIVLTQRHPGATGNIHFSMKALMQDAGGVATQLKNGPYRNPAFIPASPWLGRSAPPVPRVRTNVARPRADGGFEWVLELEPRAAEMRGYAINVGYSDGGRVRWGVWRPAAQDTFTLGRDASGVPARVALVGFDRFGNASEPLVVNVPNP
jgi:uncharacterized lipoprotein YddW (UPF0748 family)